MLTLCNRRALGLTSSATRLLIGFAKYLKPLDYLQNPSFPPKNNQALFKILCSPLLQQSEARHQLGTGYAEIDTGPDTV